MAKISKGCQKIQPKIELAEEKLGFEYEGTWIVDPTMSECSRFRVDNPCEYYGITKKQLEEIKKFNKIGVQWKNA